MMMCEVDLRIAVYSTNAAIYEERKVFRSHAMPGSYSGPFS